MKTKIKVKSIKDNNTEVAVNSPLHRIEEIKREIGDCFFAEDLSECKAEIFEMWEDK